MTFGSLFAGIGGFDLGFERAGLECKWQVEIDDYARRILAKHWPSIRRHGDVRTFPPEPAADWAVDVICGGFPCQPVSVAGEQRGQDDERWMWPDFARVVRVLRPRFVIVENVPGLLIRWIGDVLRDLASLGYDAEWSVLSACAMGAPHTRERVFIIANRDEVRWMRPRKHINDEHEIPIRYDAWEAAAIGVEWRDVQRWACEVMENGVGIVPSSERRGMDDGIPNRLERIGAVGNAIVPQIAEWIGRRLMS